MTQIDKDQVKAEIKRRYAEYSAKMETDDLTYYEGMADALDLFEQFLDNLPEQPVEGLEEEIEKWMTEDCLPVCGPSSYNPFASHWRFDDIQRTARHFYELGINSKK